MLLTFKNILDQKLSGVLDEAENPVIQAIYLHCFTCSKDHPSAYRLCKALSSKGIQVLRFDFSGLGESEGNFAESDFSSNIDDVKSALKFLKDNHLVPRLLIGHSLGGITAAAAAYELREIEAVVTIASPNRPAHILDHFEEHIPTIIKHGYADITVFDRPFRLTKEYIENLKSYDERHFVKNMNKPILIFHSPFDDIVSVDEAAKIFMEARHPKSFISLDRVDHLISKKKDAEYIAGHIDCWARRYISNL